MLSHLKERKYYEDLYDRQTVDEARRSIKYYENFYDDLRAKLPKDETVDKPGNAFVLNLFYMQAVGDELLRRYDNRDTEIAGWIARDEGRDSKVADARLIVEPQCQHCEKYGLRITDKTLLSRERNGNYDDPEIVLFTLHCSHCDKNSAYWEDGVVWEIKPTLCPKCRAKMNTKTAHTKQALVFKYSCLSCSHDYKEKMDLSTKEEALGPDFDKDRSHYCLNDKEFRTRLITMHRDFIQMAEFGKEWKEKEDNKHIYDAVKAMKKPRIAELVSLLQPVLDKDGYVEFSLDKPEIGKDVFVGFSCLDTNSDRSDSDSKKILRKLIKETLEVTNWRLMSEGISYRLGYLSGRVRAFEREEDLKQLASQSDKLMDIAKNVEKQKIEKKTPSD